MHRHKRRPSAPEELFIALAVGLCLTIRVDAQPTAFAYQGRLTDSGVSANGLFDFQFYVRDALVGGDPVGATNTLTAVAVSNGFFSVTLDFGGQVFDGSARWIEVAVRTRTEACCPT